MGIGDWGLGIGDWGLGPIPNPQSPIPNPPSPCIFPFLIYFIINNDIIYLNKFFKICLNPKMILKKYSLIINNVRYFRR